MAVLHRPVDRISKLRHVLAATSMPVTVAHGHQIFEVSHVHVGTPRTTSP